MGVSNNRKSRGADAPSDDLTIDFLTPKGAYSQGCYGNGVPPTEVPGVRTRPLASLTFMLYNTRLMCCEDTLKIMADKRIYILLFVTKLQLIYNYFYAVALG